MADRDRATDLAFDAMAQIIVEARREGIDDADTALALVNAAIGTYREIYGGSVAPYARRLTLLLAEAEAARICDLDARLIGEAQGTA